MAAKFESQVPHDIEYSHMALEFLSTVPQQVHTGDAQALQL